MLGAELCVARGRGPRGSDPRFHPLRRAQARLDDSPEGRSPLARLIDSEISKRRSDLGHGSNPPRSAQASSRGRSLWSVPCPGRRSISVRIANPFMLGPQDRRSKPPHGPGRNRRRARRGPSRGRFSGCPRTGQGSAQGAARCAAAALTDPPVSPRLGTCVMAQTTRPWIGPGSTMDRNAISGEHETARSARAALVEYFLILRDWDAGPRRSTVDPS